MIDQVPNTNKGINIKYPLDTIFVQKCDMKRKKNPCFNAYSISL